MTMLPADWVLAALVLTMAVMGLFRGFSGTLAFMVALVVAGFAGVYAWDQSVSYASETWMRGAAALVAALLSFGLVRFIVKKCVNGLLSQPTDAIFGFLCGAVAGSLVIVVWAKLGIYMEYSNIVAEVAGYVR